MESIGKYRLVRKLAEGGMAEVFLAHVEGPGGFSKPVVVKRVLPELSNDQSFIAMFMSEAKLVAQLNHPNIVQVFDFGQDNGSYFLVMEYVDGFNLRALFKRAEAAKTPIPFELAARMVSGACEGLAYAHAFAERGKPLNLIHRDVSPENLLVGSNGVVKVADFGIARVAGQKRMTRTGTVRGKLVYMAPEQMQGESVDCRVDVFALGIVLYELICARRPFEAKTEVDAMKAILTGTMIPAANWRPDTPPELQAIIDKAMARSTADRFKDCTELQVALDRFIALRGSVANTQAVGKFVEAFIEGEKASAATNPELPPVPAVTVILPPREVKTVESGPRPIAAAPAPPAPRKKSWVGAAIIGGVAVVAGFLLLSAGLSALGEDEEAVHHARPASAATLIAEVDYPVPPPPAPVVAEVVAPVAPEVVAPEPSRPHAVVKGEALAIFRDKGELWVRASKATRIRVGDQLTVVGPAEQGTAQREIYGSAAIMELKGSVGRIDEGVDVPAGSVVFAVVDKSKKPRPASVVKPSPTKLADEVPEAKPIDAEVAVVPAVTPAPLPEPVLAPKPRVLKGRLENYGSTKGVVIQNHTDFAWHECEVRLPFRKVFKFKDPIDPLGSDNIRYANFEDDARTPDAHMVNGWAMLRCREASGYLWWGPKREF